MHGVIVCLIQELHQFLRSCVDPFIQVVYNFSRGESELQSLLPWLLNIQARAPSSPVIIVGTHVDKIPRGMWSVSFTALFPGQFSLVRNIGTRSIFQTGLGTRLVSSPALVLSLEIQLHCYNVHVALLCWNSLSDQVCVWFVIFNPFPLFTHTHTRMHVSQMSLTNSR